MSMKFQYEAEMNRHGLTYRDLPEDAQTGIDQLQDIKKAIHLLEKTGKQVSPKTLKKVQAMDKWVCYEIIDHINETDENDDEMPHEDDEIIEQLSSDMSTANKEQTKEQKLGAAVEAELKALWDKGVRKVDIEDLRDDAPTCYDILFDTYDSDEENGLETSRFSLIEGSDELFHLKVK